MKTMALHAVVLGAQNKLHDVETDANAKKADADTKRKVADDAAEQIRNKAGADARKTSETTHTRQQKRIDDAHGVVSEATSDLIKHRVWAREELGIDVPDYLEQARASGRVNL